MSIRKSTATKLQLLILLLMFTSCVSITESSANNEISKTQQILVQAALDACNMGYPSTLKFNSKKFNNDCSGLIYGIFWTAGIDLIALTAKEKGNGVKRIHSILDKNHLIHKEKLPNPGDLVFWSNTYGSWGNNPLSHVGIIVYVDEKTGSIDYVHNNTYLGEIRRETMNLYHPHEKRPVNNYMRYDSKYKKTAGELFDSFGMAWLL